MSSYQKQKYLASGVEKKCTLCGLADVWNGQPIVLELDHKDGNRRNDLHENLRLLCPNCHSQQPTSNRRKNRPQTNVVKIQADAVLALFNEGKNPRQILLSLGCSDTGENYKRIRLILERYNLKYPNRIRIKLPDGRGGPKPHLRKVIWPSKDELALLAEQKSVLKIAAQFGVTGNAVVKWMNFYGIKSKPRGFWEKFYHNKLSHSSKERATNS